MIFDAGGGTLTLDQSGKFTGSIKTFNAASQIDLKDIDFNAPKFHRSYKPNQAHTRGVLTVTDGTRTAQIQIIGNYTEDQFKPQSDGGNGTLINYQPPPASMALFVIHMASACTASGTGANGSLLGDASAIAGPAALLAHPHA